MATDFCIVTLRVLAAAGLVLAAAAPASAEPRRYRVPYDAVHGGPEGRGCYWVRQRLYCSRYCYVEVDGRRYCQERARLAYPQAPYFEDFRGSRRSVK